MAIFDIVRRLEAEPAQDDLARGFSAEVADPLWLLGRQWQLGEHQGEDASSPVRVEHRTSLTAIDPMFGDPEQDPRAVPAEALVESEPDDFWTAGRRVTAGRVVAAAAADAGADLPDDPELLLDSLPAPYDVLDGTGPDGRVLWQRRTDLGLDEAWFGDLRPVAQPRDAWDAAEFAYDADFGAASRTLRLRRHDGGDLDWYSVDADGALPEPTPLPAATEIIPVHLRHPGAPAPRWWEIEDAAVDIGGHPPDRSHVATLLLIDLIVNQSDDWFTFPLEALAGHIVTIHEAIVVDDFGDRWTLSPPSDGWSMFATEGLDASSLVVWSTAATPLVGPVLDEVVLGVDEDANLVWAVERRLQGCDVLTDEDPLPAIPEQVDGAAQPGFEYRSSTRVPAHWHPYVIEEVSGRRRFVQGRAADLSQPGPAVLLPAAESDLLQDPASGGTHPVHQVEPAAIPADGIRLERRALLARRTDGSPVLWAQRRRLPLLTPPALRLRFDVLEPAPAEA